MFIKKIMKNNKLLIPFYSFTLLLIGLGAIEEVEVIPTVEAYEEEFIEEEKIWTLVPAERNYEEVIEEEELEEDLFYIPSGLPVEGEISSVFGERINPVTGEEEIHKGIDFAVDTGTPVYSTASGVVTSARYSESYGYVVEIEHSNEFSTLYAHNSELLVENGDIVAKGSLIAYSGSSGEATGPHVHYEVKVNNEAVDPCGFIE